MLWEPCPPRNLKVKTRCCGGLSRKLTEGDEFKIPTMIQLAAFYIYTDIFFLGRPEVPDLNFNLGSVIERGTKVEKMWNYDGSR